MATSVQPHKPAIQPSLLSSVYHVEKCRSPSESACHLGHFHPDPSLKTQHMHSFALQWFAVSTLQTLCKVLSHRFFRSTPARQILGR